MRESPPSGPKPNAEYRSLVVLDLPDGSRTTFFANTPGELQMGSEVFVWESALGWELHHSDQTNRPFPMDHVMVVESATSFKGAFGGRAEEGLPWILYCKAVPDHCGMNLRRYEKTPASRVPKGQRAWRDCYDANGRLKPKPVVALVAAEGVSG